MKTYHADVVKVLSGFLGNHLGDNKSQCFFFFKIKRFNVFLKICLYYQELLLLVKHTNFFGICIQEEKVQKFHNQSDNHRLK